MLPKKVRVDTWGLPAHFARMLILVPGEHTLHG